VFRNGIYNMFGAGIRLALTLGTLPLLIATIGLSEYGLWSLVTTAINIIVLAEAGLSVSTTVFLAQGIARSDDLDIARTLTTTFSALAALAAAVALLVWMGASWLVGAFPALPAEESGAVVEALRLSALVIWAQMLQQWCGGIIQAHQRYGLLNALTTMQTLLQTVGLLVIALLGGRTLAFMQWYIGVGLFMLAGYGGTAGWLLRRRRLRLNWDRCHGLTVLRYSGLSWVASLGTVLFTRGDRLIVGATLGTEPLGIYAAITNITGQINTISALPVQPLLPAVSGHGQGPINERSPLVHSLKRALQINSVVALGLGAGGLLFAPQIMGLIMPQASAESIFGFRLATCIYALYSVNAVGFYLLFALKHVTTCTIIQLASGSLACLLIWGLSARYGFIGALLGNAGYLGVWGLSIASFRYTAIRFSKWSGWIAIPLAWFLATIWISFVIPAVFIIQSGVFIALLIYLGWWFAREFIGPSTPIEEVVYE
jgi:O-antigen/teichoic acid export membrane protein